MTTVWQTADSNFLSISFKENININVKYSSIQDLLLSNSHQCKCSDTFNIECTEPFPHVLVSNTLYSLVHLRVLLEYMEAIAQQLDFE